MKMPPLPTSLRRTYFLVLLPVVAFTAWMELGLRTALLARFGSRSLIAGSLPNAVAVVLISLIFAVIRGEVAGANPRRLIMNVMLGMLAYEVAQIWMPGRTFDPLDLVASLIGGMVPYPLLSIPYRLTTPSDEAAAQT